MKKPKKITRLYVSSMLTIAQIAQLKIWLGGSDSEIIRNAVDEKFEREANAREK